MKNAESELAICCGTTCNKAVVQQELKEQEIKIFEQKNIIVGLKEEIASLRKLIS